MEIPRGSGVLRVKILEAKYEAKLEFPGGMGDAKRKTFPGGSTDVFLELHNVSNKGESVSDFQIPRSGSKNEVQLRFSFFHPFNS